MRNRARRRRGADGQVLAGVLVVLMIMCTLVPLLVFFAMRESNWTQKQARSTRAFQMAESGVEKGYLKLTLSTSTWVNLMLGGSNAVVSNYHFDKTYTDVNGGSYVISITSGPASQEATILSVGKDPLSKELRGIQAIYANAPMNGDVAIYAKGGADVGNGVTVEWGAIASPATITPNGNYPQLWSAGAITGLSSSPNPPNCDSPDCCWWHAYQTNMPPAPSIDLHFYATQAEGALNTTYNCPSGSDATKCTSLSANCCYYTGAQSWSGNTIGSLSAGATLYVNGDLTIGSPGDDIIGALIVTGNLYLPNGSFGKGSHPFYMPPNAWKQYCGDWGHYTGTFDNTAPANFPGLNSKSYTSPSTCNGSVCGNTGKTFVDGLLYVQGFMGNSGGGGGNGDIYGAMYVVGVTTMASHSGVTFYYNSGAGQNLVTTQVLLSRQSWQDYLVNSFP